MPGDENMQLGLQDLLVRLSRFESDVRSNVDRIGDSVLELDRKLDRVAESSARIEGLVQEHVHGEGMWRAELSGRFHQVEFSTQEAAQKTMAKADKAFDLANEAMSSKRQWRGNVSTAVAVIAVLGAVLALLTNYWRAVMDHRGQAEMVKPVPALVQPAEPKGEAK